MFPTDSNNSCNSFTVPFSDQTFLFSKLLEGFATDDKNPNPFPPFSPFSIFDQFNTHLCFLPADHDQPPELQNSPWEHHHEELKLPVVSAGQDLITATSTCSTGGNGGTENFHGSGFAGDPANGSSSSAVGRAKHDVVRKNRSLSKKDRHSKINTAQGPRDRRMRLSLDIAQRFFGLQDMLGFDKASKTVDWLLCKSQSEISRVSRSRRSDVISASDSFAASECCNEVSEVVSKDDVSRAVEIDKVSKKTGSKEKKSGKAASSVSSSRRDGFNNFSKESREKARARARERTKERKPAELLNPQSHHSYGDHQGQTISDHHETLENISYWNPSSTIFNHRQNNGASQQMQFGDIQSYPRPWETYNYGKSNMY